MLEGAYRGRVLHGRDSERARLAALLAEARGGNAATLLVRGGAGVGKSALLDDTADRAETVREAGFRVLRTVGLRAEAAFPFAALHRLLRSRACESRRPSDAVSPSATSPPRVPSESDAAV